jgi:hypothetical protein
VAEDDIAVPDSKIALVLQRPDQREGRTPGERFGIALASDSHRNPTGLTMAIDRAHNGGGKAGQKPPHVALWMTGTAGTKIVFAR